MKRLFFLSLLLLIVACEKTEKSNVPYSPVRFEVDLQFLDKDLSGLLNYKTFTSARNAGERTGYSGILVVHGFDAYYAYDLCCPYEAQQSVRVQPTTEGTAKCPSCGSVYDIANGAGNPMSGPSKHYLVRFNVYTSGQRLIIEY